MASELQFPKVNGDKWYGTEVNKIQDVLASATFGVITSGTGGAFITTSAVLTNWFIRNTSSVDVYVSFTSSATTAGFLLPAGEDLTMNISSQFLGIKPSVTTSAVIRYIGQA